MKTFKQFLLEDNLSGSPEEIAALIKRDCAHFLNESKFDANNQTTWLWRGIRYHHGPISKIPVDATRNATDTHEFIHNAINAGLKDLTGVDFRSGQIIFATGDRRTAATYGNLLVAIFPTGNFDYCWSPKIEDAYTYFDNHTYGSPDGYADMGKALGYEFDHTSGNSWGQAVKDYIIQGHAQYQFNKHLDKAIAFGHEIMISCKEYYALTWHSDPMNDEFMKLDDDKNHKSYQVMELLK